MKKSVLLLIFAGIVALGGIAQAHGTSVATANISYQGTSVVGSGFVTVDVPHDGIAVASDAYRKQPGGTWSHVAGALAFCVSGNPQSCGTPLWTVYNRNCRYYYKNEVVTWVILDVGGNGHNLDNDTKVKNPTC